MFAVRQTVQTGIDTRHTHDDTQVWKLKTLLIVGCVFDFVPMNMLCNYLQWKSSICLPVRELWQEISPEERHEEAHIHSHGFVAHICVFQPPHSAYVLLLGERAKFIFIIFYHLFFPPPAVIVIIVITLIMIIIRNPHTKIYRWKTIQVYDMLQSL